MAALGIGLGIHLTHRNLWTPSRLPGLIGIWYPENSLTAYGPNMRPDIGDPVVRVLDPVLGNDLIQSDGNLQPLYSYFNGVDSSAGYAWEFNGTNTLLISDLPIGITGDTELTIYAVGRAEGALGSGQTILSMTRLDSPQRVLAFFNRPTWVWNYGPGDRTSNIASSMSAFTLCYRKRLGAAGNPGVEEFSINNVIASSITGNESNVLNLHPDNHFLIGGHNAQVPQHPWRGVIGAIIVCNVRHSDALKAHTLTWLTRRYGL